MGTCPPPFGTSKLRAPDRGWLGMGGSGKETPMGTTSAPRRRLKSLYRVFALLLVVMTLLPLPAAAQTSSGTTSPRANQWLLHQAAQNPNGSFRVIVLPSLLDGSVLALVSARGDQILGNVASIGFVAQVNGNEIAALAVVPGVGYITADAPILSTAGCRSPLGSCNLAPVHDPSVQATPEPGAAPAYSG